MGKLTILGTSHIAKESIEAVKTYIATEHPTHVAIELDAQRLRLLLEKPKGKRSFSDIRRIGVTGYLFAMMGSYIAKKLGEKTGVMPGDEMLAAFHAAKKQGAQIILIDQNIMITLQRFSRFITFREKMRFACDLLRALFMPKRELELLGIKELDLSKVPSKELITKLIARIKVRYPNVYRVIIAERDRHMAAVLKHLAGQHPDAHILAVVGAGHEEGMENILKLNAEQ